MREVLHNILTRRNWFFGAVVVLGIIYVLGYRAIDPAGFYQSVNSLFRFAWEMIRVIFALAIALVGIRMILGGKKPWWLGGK